MRFQNQIIFIFQNFKHIFISFCVIEYGILYCVNYFFHSNYILNVIDKLYKNSTKNLRVFHSKLNMFELNLCLKLITNKILLKELYKNC